MLHRTPSEVKKVSRPLKRDSLAQLFRLSPKELDRVVQSGLGGIAAGDEALVRRYAREIHERKNLRIPLEDFVTLRIRKFKEQAAMAGPLWTGGGFKWLTEGRQGSDDNSVRLL